MFAIETDLGRFEAETEKEAKKLLRAAQAKDRKEREIKKGLYDLARMRAQANGYWVYSRLAEEKEFPRGWSYHDPLGKYSPATLSYSDSLSRTPKITWQGEHGTAESEHYGYDFWGCVSNGAGFPLLAFIRDRHSKVIECYAIGIEQDQCCWVAMHGITIDQFNHSEREPSEETARPYGQLHPDEEMASV